jgi:hypothetical protein
VLQDDEHAGVAVCLVDVFVEQLQRALDVGGCAGGGTVRSRPNANSLEKGVCIG